LKFKPTRESRSLSRRELAEYIAETSRIMMKLAEGRGMIRVADHLSQASSAASAAASEISMPILH
jgi:hypothetical protein